MRNCHVRRLAIQAPDSLAAARGAVLVEDALRTASLPGESSRLLIVRRLHIGAIPAGANATAVSRSIEAALAEVPAQAVAAADPAAGSAAAVYFADEVEACVQLAVLGARRKAPDAWFWPRAVAGWRNGYDAAYAVRCALGAAARQSSSPDAGAHAVVRVAGGLLAADALDGALAALEPEDGPVLLRLCGWRSPMPGAGAAARPGQQSPIPPWSTLTPQNSRRLAAWAATWGAADARTLWLAAALLAAEQPSRTRDPALAAQAAVWVEQVSAPPAARSIANKTAANQTAAGKAVAPTPAQRDEVDEGVDSAPASLPLVKPASSPPGVQTSSPAAPPPETPLPEGGASLPAAPLVWWRGLSLRPTEAGGLWFLLPVLARLGINAWLLEHPDEAGNNFPWRVLAELARMAETPPLDPVWAVLRQETGAGMRPAEEQAGTSALPLDRSAAPMDDANQAVVWWRSRVQEWCAALTDFGGPEECLTAIVWRRGWLYTTPTHIDVFFEPAQADLRIRRLGLDIDPGWLPWLRRVVTFYYEAGSVEYTHSTHS